MNSRAKKYVGQGREEHIKYGNLAHTRKQRRYRATHEVTIGVESPLPTKFSEDDEVFKVKDLGREDTLIGV